MIPFLLQSMGLITLQYPVCEREAGESEDSLTAQGSFREHISSLNRLTGVTGVEIRTKEQLAAVDGLIIPGGEYLVALEMPVKLK